MRTINELKELLTINELSEVALEARFAQIADALLNGYAITKNGKLYKFVEIEFYHNLTDPKEGKVKTYPRIAKAGEWFFHNSGVDLTFNSTENSYGGILIRSIKSDESFVCGPFNVVDELFDQFNALEIPSNFPLIVPTDCSEKLAPVDTTRWHVDNDKRYRYCIPYTEWNKANGYQAYPWYCNGELKKPANDI